MGLSAHLNELPLRQQINMSMLGYEGNKRIIICEQVAEFVTAGWKMDEIKDYLTDTSKCPYSRMVETGPDYVFE